MSQVGTDNLSAYLRKIAIDGYIVKLDLPELREMISLLRRSSNNLNQIAKRLNETGRFYAADLEDMLRRQEQLWQTANRESCPALQWRADRAYAPFPSLCCGNSRGTMRMKEAIR